MVKERESNFELLRMFSMLTVMFYHFLTYSQSTDFPGLKYIGESWLIFAHMGLMSFIMISGYWGITFSLRKFLRLFFYCSLYSILIYLTAVLINPELYSIKTLLISIIPPWWPVRIYLLLYLFSPLINIPLKTDSNRKKLLYIIILIVISYPLRHLLPPLPYVENPFSFILIYYYVGSYLRTGITWPGSLSVKKMGILYLSCNIILFTTMLLSYEHIPFIMKVIRKLFIQYNGIGLIINAALLLLIFTQFKFHSKYINWISRSALAVYLIHENAYLSPYLHGFVNRFLSVIESPALMVFSFIPIVILVFILSVILDKLISPVYFFFTKQIIKEEMIDEEHFL